MLACKALFETMFWEWEEGPPFGGWARPECVHYSAVTQHLFFHLILPSTMVGFVIFSLPVKGGSEVKPLSFVKFCLSPSLSPLSLPSPQLRGVPLHCLRGLCGIYSQLETLICSRSIQALEVRRIRAGPRSLFLGTT